MQPWKVMFFALFLTSNIITMLVRNLVHGYKHDSATGFVCFACFPLSFGCPRIFLLGILELVCFFTLFDFVTLGPAWGAEGGGNIESVFQGPVPILFSCRMGRRGILKTWVLSLIPIWIISIFFILKTYSGPRLSCHLNYFRLLKCSLWLRFEMFFLTPAPKCSF